MADTMGGMTFGELCSAVGRFLGWGGDSELWGEERTALIAGYVNQGYLEFLAGLDPRTGRAYTWDFLCPEATITLWPSGSGAADGAPEHADGISTVTVDGLTMHPSMVGHAITFGATGNEYVVCEWVSPSVVRVDGDASGEAGGDAVGVTADGRYSLPGDFAAVKSVPALGPEDGGGVLVERSYSSLARMAAASGSATGRPAYYTVVPGEGSAAADGSGRWRLRAWPTPAQELTAGYRYRIHPAALSAAGDVPLGGLLHGQAILTHALAVAEARELDGQENQRGLAERRMAASIDLDARMRPRRGGAMCFRYEVDLGRRLRTGVEY